MERIHSERALDERTHLGVKFGDLLLVHARPPVDSALVTELSEDKSLQTNGGRVEVRSQGCYLPPGMGRPC